MDDKIKDIFKIGQQAKDAALTVAQMSTDEKNEILLLCAKKMIEYSDEILAANNEDLQNAVDIKESFKDRLTLTKSRILSMADGLQQVAALPDPIGDILSMHTLSNGLIVGQKRVPIGVIGIIYEARPNVTADAFGLCFKAGSSVILRGGKEAIKSNAAIVSIFQKVLAENNRNINMVQLITDRSREKAKQMMQLNGYIDVLIPRGGASLIQSVVKNSTVPVIETGVGNCHIYIDETADIDMAISIVINAKTQRPGVCNAMEKLIVHEKIADAFLPKVCAKLREKGVELRGDAACCKLIEGCKLANEDDWNTEYADLILAIKIVPDFDTAVLHIQKYSSGHSEAIITKDYTFSQRFLQKIDSAAVYVNASTRFTDGNEFGFGAEIGISTQKLHARGPMGLKELTSTKYIIFGNGQIRS